jgi:antirestriction protein ArdC
MPQRASFTGSATSTATEAYYSTVLHELTHWTAPPHRCNRDLSGRFGSEAYAMEELVAELGAAFLCAELGITAEPRADHAQYLTHWLTVLKADKRAIFTAASKAAQASAFLESAAAGEASSAIVATTESCSKD